MHRVAPKPVEVVPNHETEERPVARRARVDFRCQGVIRNTGELLHILLMGHDKSKRIHIGIVSKLSRRLLKGMAIAQAKFRRAVCGFAR